jgi:hypothetical protein
MSSILPLNWADKKNSPLLADFIAKYGTEYCMTAEEINQLRDAINEMAVIQQSTFLGAAEPTFTPGGTGRAYWIAVKKGTYANYGGVVVASSEVAFIIRDAAGAFSITKSAVTTVAGPPGADSIVPGPAGPTGTAKILTWIAGAYALGDQVNYLGKDWTANSDTLMGDIPGTSTKWVERLSGYSNTEITKKLEETYSADSFSVTDLLGFIAMYVDKATGDLITNKIKTNKLFINGVEFLQDSIVPTYLLSNNYEYEFVIIDENGYIIFAIPKGGSIKGVFSNATKYNPYFSSDILHVISYGQSLSVGFKTNAISTASQNNSLMFQGGTITWDTAPAATKYDTLVLLKETAKETLISGAVNSAIAKVVQKQANTWDSLGSKILGSAAGISGVSIGGLKKGTTNYNQLLQDVTSGKARANELGKSYTLPVLFWTHGEANVGNTQLSYYTDLKQLVIDFNADVKVITGQVDDVQVIMTQLSRQASATSSNIQYAIAQVCDELANAHLANPSYIMSYGDTVHMNATSYRLLGAYYGKVMERVLFNKLTYSPLKIVKTLAQSNIVQVFYNNESDLVFDVATVTNPNNYGFRVLNSALAELTISSVVITRKDCITITLSAPLTAGCFLTYADFSASGIGATVGSRGNVREANLDYYLEGSANIKLYNWCTMFNKLIN